MQMHLRAVGRSDNPGGRGTKVKVDNILKGSLDSIPSPSLSVKTQIMGGNTDYGHPMKA